MTPDEQMAHIIVDLESMNVDEMTETQRPSLWEWWSVQKKCRHGFKTCNLASSESKKS
jgi:hypothetical protein